MEQLLSLIEPITRGLELAGVAAVVVGTAVSTVLFVSRLRQGLQTAYEDYRKHLARSILLGLEFLVAADIIQTVGVHPTLENVTVLAVIVLIRSFLSISLEMEVSGRWPWQRERTGHATGRST